MRIPSACSLCAGSAEEHRGREQALNLAVTLKLLTSSSSPSRARTPFYLKGLVRIKASLKRSHTRVKGCNVALHICGGSFVVRTGPH